MQNPQPAPVGGFWPNFRPLLRDWQDRLEAGLQVGLGFAGVITFLELAVQAPSVRSWEVQSHAQLTQWLGSHMQPFLLSAVLRQPSTVSGLEIGMAVLGVIVVTILLLQRR